MFDVAVRDVPDLRLAERALAPLCDGERLLHGAVRVDRRVELKAVRAVAKLGAVQSIEAAVAAAGCGAAGREDVGDGDRSEDVFNSVAAQREWTLLHAVRRSRHGPIGEVGCVGRPNASQTSLEVTAAEPRATAPTIARPPP